MKWGILVGTNTGVKYIGKDAVYEDNILRTGLTWSKGEIHILPVVMAKEFLKHPGVFAEVPGASYLTLSLSAQGVRNFGDLVSASFALTYDAAGRVATRTDGRGIWTLTYDAAGRLVTEVCLDVTRTHSYGTDGRWSGVVES